MGRAAPGRQDGSPPPSILEVLGPQCLQQLALGEIWYAAIHEVKKSWT